MASSNKNSEVAKLAKALEYIVSVAGTSPEVDSALQACAAVSGWKYPHSVDPLRIVATGTPEQIQEAMTQVATTAPPALMDSTGTVRSEALTHAYNRMKTARKDTAPLWFERLGQEYREQADKFTAEYKPGQETDLRKLFEMGGEAVDRYKRIQAAADGMNSVVLAGLKVVDLMTIPRVEIAFRSDAIVTLDELSEFSDARSAPFGYSGMLVDRDRTLSFPADADELLARIENR